MITAISSYKQNGVNVNSKNVNKKNIHFSSKEEIGEHLLKAAKYYGVKVENSDTVASLTQKLSNAVEANKTWFDKFIDFCDKLSAQTPEEKARSEQWRKDCEKNPFGHNR